MVRRMEFVLDRLLMAPLRPRQHLCNNSSISLYKQAAAVKVPRHQGTFFCPYIEGEEEQAMMMTWQPMNLMYLNLPLLSVQAAASPSPPTGGHQLLKPCSRTASVSLLRR
jgi:hypothetical protein